MTQTEILQSIREVLRQHISITSVVGMDTDLSTDLHLDSLQKLTLVVEIENRFKIFLPDDQHGIETLADLVGVIEAQLQAPAQMWP